MPEATKQFVKSCLQFCGPLSGQFLFTRACKTIFYHIPFPSSPLWFAFYLARFKGLQGLYNCNNVPPDAAPLAYGVYMCVKGALGGQRRATDTHTYRAGAKGVWLWTRNNPNMNNTLFVRLAKRPLVSGEVGVAGTEIQEVGGGWVGPSPNGTVTTVMTAVLRQAALRTIWMFHSLWRAKSQDGAYKTTGCEEKGEPRRGIEPTPSAYQPTALPLGQPSTENEAIVENALLITG